VNANKNWLNGSTYDQNGNVTTLNNATLSYDVENRLSEYTTGSFVENYAYDEANRRVDRWSGTTYDNVYFYGPNGKLLTVVQVNFNPTAPYVTASTLSNRIYFGRMLLGTTNGQVNTDSSLIKDRLGSVQPSYVYGTATGSGEQTSPGDDFATYWKDTSTGFEYAMNRYYSAGYGRFLTVDPFGGSARAGSPLSWNRYGYAGGDPVNRRDPSGLLMSAEDCTDDPDLCEDEDWGSGGYCPIGPGFAGSFDPGDDDSGTLGGVYFGGIPGLAPCGLIPGDDGGGGGGAPECSISLHDRPVAHTGGAFFHTYLDVSEVSASGVLEFNDVLEGGPTNPHNFLKHPFTPWGNLVAHAEPVPPPGTPILPNTYFLGATNPSKDPTLASEVGGANVCYEITELLDAMVDYGNTKGVPYALWPKGSSRNSNSFTYTLLYDIGLSALFGPSVSFAPGWGMLVPGLH
jgi:RHS repeat-associated protein